jgi:hypothetical protein
MQNVSVFVSSSTQLKLPHNKTPQRPPTMTMPPTEKRVVGCAIKAHVLATNPSRGEGAADGSLKICLRGDQLCDEKRDVS